MAEQPDQVLRRAEARAEQRGFRLGVLWAAWWLHAGHGEDTYAAELLRESLSASTAQRLARAEQYTFKRGFWAQSEFRRGAR